MGRMGSMEWVLRLVYEYNLLVVFSIVDVWKTWRVRQLSMRPSTRQNIWSIPFHSMHTHTMHLRIWFIAEMIRRSVFVCVWSCERLVSFMFCLQHTVQAERRQSQPTNLLSWRNYNWKHLLTSASFNFGVFVWHANKIKWLHRHKRN